MRRNLPDNKTVVSASQGDKRSQDQLARAIQPVVETIAWNVLEDRDAVEDVTQDTMLRVFKYLPNFRFRSDLSTWVYRITINLCFDYLRKQRRFRELNPLSIEEGVLEDGSPLEIADFSQDPATLVQGTITEDGVSRALNKLSDEYRELLAMRGLEHMGYEEMCRETGLSMGTVKSRLFRGRKRLETILRREKVTV